jgi:hypothetical protein
MGYFVDSLFRKDLNTAAVPTPAPLSEVARIFMNAIRTGPLPAKDIRYVAQLVAQPTGLSHQEAEKRVTDTFARVQAKLPVLGAIAIHAVNHTLHPSLFRPYLVWRRDRLVVVAAVLGVLILGVLDGLLAAIGMTLFMMLQRLSESSVVSTLGRLAQSHDFVNLAMHPDAWPITHAHDQKRPVRLPRRTRRIPSVQVLFPRFLIHAPKRSVAETLFLTATKPDRASDIAVASQAGA